MPSFEVRGAIRDRRKRGATVEQCTKAVKGARMLWNAETNKLYAKHLRQPVKILSEAHFGACVAAFNDGEKKKPPDRSRPDYSKDVITKENGGVDMIAELRRAGRIP